MQNVITKKEYRHLVRRQEKIEMQVSNLFRIVQRELADEVTDEYRKKLDRWSKEMDEGAGRKFFDVKEMKKYLRSL